ncbi:MAG: hypothetical protein JSR44_10625 [Spirochaetes bacterium]|nr:hypothetical protein [Spirochaetota bacterium]
MQNRYAKYFIFFIAILPLYANAPDRAFCEKILGENKHFIDFLNSGISNFATADDIQTFEGAAREHYLAHKEYLAGHYKKTHAHIRAAQNILKDLYYTVLNKYYQKDTRELLERNSAMIIETRDVRAAHFMRLGYRDLKVSEIYEGKGFNHNKFLYSTKIWFYIDAIKYARQAKRYAFLAIIESQTPYTDKDDFKQQSLDDYFNKPEVEKQRDFDRVFNRLTNLINRKLVVNNYDFFFHHYDNYAYINTGKTNCFEAFVSKMAKGKP